MKKEQLSQFKIPIGISNKHVHISKEHLEILFGEGYELTKKVDLVQPGQFASNETITIRSSKREIKNVRILGPIRRESQVEISLTDSYFLGLEVPIKESGDHDVTPGLQLIGPKGVVNMEKGTIVAFRHIHISPEQAASFGVKDKDIVKVETFGERGGVLGNILVRVSDQFELEMHIDTDEANAFALKNKDYVVLQR